MFTLRRLQGVRDAAHAAAALLPAGGLWGAQRQRQRWRRHYGHLSKLGLDHHWRVHMQPVERGGGELHSAEGGLMSARCSCPQCSLRACMLAHT
eukprot:jgi/Mesen1/1062/ME000123S00231